MTSASRKIGQSALRLDALFDYSRSRPAAPVISFDDDDDDVQVVTDPKPSTSGRQHSSILEAVKDTSSKSDEAGAVVDDNDWLERPPPPPGCPRVPSTDPTLLKLRLQKQELKSIWEVSVENAEEAASLKARIPEAAISKQQDTGKCANAQNGTSEETPNKRQKILLKLQTESGESHGVRVFVDEKLDRVFTHYANNVGKRPRTDFVFRFDGQQLDANSSPKDLDLEDEDIVEVSVKKPQK